MAKSDSGTTVESNGTRIQVADKLVESIVDVAAIGGITLAALNGVASQTVVAGIMAVAGAKKATEYARGK